MHNYGLICTDTQFPLPKDLWDLGINLDLSLDFVSIYCFPPLKRKCRWYRKKVQSAHSAVLPKTRKLDLVPRMPLCPGNPITLSPCNILQWPSLQSCRLVPLFIKQNFWVEEPWRMSGCLCAKIGLGFSASWSHQSLPEKTEAGCG